jgi:hypothetical protein
LVASSDVPSSDTFNMLPNGRPIKPMTVHIEAPTLTLLQGRRDGAMIARWQTGSPENCTALEHCLIYAPAKLLTIWA